MPGRRTLVISERFRPESFLVNDIVAEWRREERLVDVLTQVPSYPRDAIFPGFKNRLFQLSREGRARTYRVRTFLGYSRSVVRKIVNYASFAVLSTAAAVVLGPRYRSVYVYQTGPLTQAIPAVVMKLLYGCRTVIWTQDVWPDSVFAYGFPERGIFAGILTRFVRWCYAHFDVVHVSSPGFPRLLAVHVAKGKNIRYIPQWAPPELGRGAARTGEIPFARGKVHFTFAGNIGKFQNLENVILGFEIAHRCSSNIQLNIVGSGSMADGLRVLCDSRKIAGVEFWGQKPISEALDWMEASDFLVLSLSGTPVFSLTVPAKFQAYLRAGRGILAAARGDAAAIIRAQGIGAVADPDNPQAIADSFIQLASMNAADRTKIEASVRSLDAGLFDRTKLLAAITRDVFHDGTA